MNNEYAPSASAKKSKQLKVGIGVDPSAAEFAAEKFGSAKNQPI